MGDWTAALLVRGFFGLLRWTPRPLARFGCRRIADLFYLLDRKHRRIGLCNLGIAFPDRDASWHRRTLRESFRQLGDLAVEIARFPAVTAEELRRRFPYEEGRGLENYREARRQSQAGGRGILFVTAHVGPWEILPAAHAVQARPLSFVVRPLDNPWLERWVRRLRCRFGNGVLSKHKAMRPILAALDQGRDVGFLIDQNVQESEGVYVPLFGRPASTTPAVAALALKTGLPVVCGFACPGPRPGHYRIRFYPPLTFRPSGDREADLRRATARLNQCIEEVIREYPQCWLWGHRRFATQPDGADPYRGG